LVLKKNSQRLFINMEPVLRCIYDMEPCYEALNTYLRNGGDIDARGPRGLTLLAHAIHTFLTYAGTTLKNIDALLQRGADPHADGSFALAASFGNHLGLLKLFIGAPRFNPQHLETKSMNYEINVYLTQVRAVYNEALDEGLPFLLRTRFTWPIPGMLLKTLPPSARAELHRIAAEDTPRNVRNAFFNKTSAAHRLPTAVAQHICKFFFLPAGQRATLRDYARLL